MNEPLTSEEKGFLRELQLNTLWANILSKLERPYPKLYRPSDDAPETEFRKWIYESARKRENDDLLTILKQP